MAAKAPISVAFYGFSEEQGLLMHAAFDHADKWPRPWKITQALDQSHVVILRLESDDDFPEFDKLTQDLPNAVIIAFSAKKPPNAKWHLQKQDSGTFSTFAFSQLVLKIAHTIKQNLSNPSKVTAKAITPADNPNQTDDKPASLMPVFEDSESEPEDLLSFFNQLDTLMDSKPIEKRKRFNEK
jgi:hypothetical protein